MSFIVMEKPFSFRYSEFDIYDHVLPSAVLGAFQDIAGEHAASLGIGYEPLLVQNMIWVLVRSRYVILQQPKVDEHYILRTWPEPSGVIDFNRNYEMVDGAGKTIIKGMSKWAVTNFRTRKLVRARCLSFGEGDFYSKKVFTEDLANFRPREVKSLTSSLSHTVRFTDLDHNHHMNNTKYATLALDAMDLEEDEMITDFQINHLLECQKGDLIDVFTLKENNGTRVIGTKNQLEMIVFDTFIKVSII